MRKQREYQMLLGQTSIENLRLDLKCRDDIPALLAGLQSLYLNKELSDRILAILKDCISKNGSLDHGRPGMDLWRILVLGVLRLGAALDYDRLHDLANKHFDVRVMLLTGGFEGEQWTHETIKENVRLLTPEILNQISQIVVESGHSLLKKNGEKTIELKGRCDSFVVETDVHYPTDITLLYDALRKIISLMIWISHFENIKGWRQAKHLSKRAKKLVREIGRFKKLVRNSKGRMPKDEKKAEQKLKELERKQEQVLQLHRELLELSRTITQRAENDLKECKPHKNVDKALTFIEHSKRQIDQIQRRVLQGEKIPAEEKVYSIFEPYTEWITKGKAGVPQELGVRVSILEDQYGFILHHMVMEKETDDKIAVSIVEETKKRFPNLKSCSFDKGYHSPENKEKLSELLDEVILPKKGKLSASQIEEETSESFVKARHQHSAVESGINCLEHHGLDRCFDHGIDGFKRHVALSILSKNIYQLGRFILEKERKRRMGAGSFSAAA